MHKKISSLKTKSSSAAAAGLKQAAKKTAAVRPDYKKLLEDLHIRQVELEAQNDELRATQQALEESRTRYADLFELAPVGYFTFDRQGVIMEVNLRGASQLGQSRSSLVRKPFASHLDSRHVQAFRVHHSQVMTTGKRCTCELEFIRQDRTRFLGRLDSVPLIRQDGRDPRCFSALTNITERKQVEEALRESEEKFRLIAELSTDIIFQLDQDGVIAYVSPAVGRHGFKPEELCGKEFTAFIHPKDLARTGHAFRQVSSDGRIDMLEVLLRNADGSYSHAEINITPLQRQGAFAGIQGISRDITERKRYEQAILQSLRRFELLSGNADKLLQSTEPQSAAESVCAKVMEHLDCQVFFNFLVDDKAGKLRLNAFAGIPVEEAKKIEWLDFGVAVCGCVALDGKRIVAECIPASSDERTALVKSYGVRAYACHPLMGPGGRVIGTLSFGAKNRDAFSDDDLYLMKAVADQVAIAMNRMNDERALRTAHKELERRSWELEAVNRELDAFSYAVSNDLKAPLRSIEGFSTALLEDHAPNLNAEGNDYLVRVNAAVKRMIQLVEALLNMARQTGGEIHAQEVDLSGLAQIAEHELRRQDPQRKVEFTIAPGVKASGDRQLLQVVLENLLHNAWKFTSCRDEAKIEFGVNSSEFGDKTESKNSEPRTADSGPSPSDSEPRAPDSRLIYYVRDNGAGFDMNFADNLFMPFRRLHTKSEFPGLGIGLATANRIILRHNGRLWAESAPDKGATFYFTL